MRMTRQRLKLIPIHILHEFYLSLERNAEVPDRLYKNSIRGYTITFIPVLAVYKILRRNPASHIRVYRKC